MGQEDSTRIRRDSLRTGEGIGVLPMSVKSGISGVGVEDYRLEPLHEAGQEVPVSRLVRQDPDLRLPYQENPSLRFKGDFRTEGSLWRWRTGQIYGTGSQTSLPGIGRRNEAAFSFEQELNDRLSLQATVDAVRMNMAYFNRRQSLGLSGALVYRAQDHLWFTAFGSARTGDFLNMQSYSYGGTVGFDITDRFSLELGVQRFYNDLTGRWETLPVVMPGYRFNDKFKLEFDVGPLIYELIRNVIIDHRGGRSDGGPTIRPPVPGFK
ncbi:MAG TPA: hypothetical protein H9807_01625 [Candidatus Bacteroides merdavium]|uniref:Uncharacterized protein n=1 Tax=Candidatus Bacteroides merdavium TaxID=2838472 RepID=A0A9D2KBV3_9BACE|nr:hypothetical protein [Candidatus Bacteroides merdavium]